MQNKVRPNKAERANGFDFRAYKLFIIRERQALGCCMFKVRRFDLTHKSGREKCRLEDYILGLERFFCRFRVTSP